MAPRTASSGASNGTADPTTKNVDDRRWVTVSWMPHASLSQTSNVAISIKSILASIDVLSVSRMGSSATGGGSHGDNHTDNDDDNNIVPAGGGVGGVHCYGGNLNKNSGGITGRRQDWKVSVTIHGVAGLDLVPVGVMTPSAPLLPINEQQQRSNRKSWKPLVAEATHICLFDDDTPTTTCDGGNGRECILHVPLRWRELPRDSYLKFQVTGPGDNLVSQSLMCCA